ncbi:C40 family peptidase (plasmid) [Pontibacillus sp. ALD_SL1]|uniref:C40 family peptidase n=1 Tax=Pontibacillus sp. ALD_SL1 TaxID=2777185 RepID=UPI001A969944|nr:C40 family peptidase [Pontibacillus sp. ALD_SL1]
MKKISKLFTVVGLSVSVLTSQAFASSQIGTLEVEVDRLYLRSGSTLQSEPIRFLYTGERYKVYEIKNNMYNLGGNQWVTTRDDYVEFHPLEGTKPVVDSKEVKITAYYLNIRQHASFSSKVVGVTKRNKVFTVLEEKNGLYRIGANQWISANQKYVQPVSGSSFDSSPPKTIVPKTQVPTSSAVTTFAKKFLGMPYVWGSSNPSYGGFDCSGFIYYVYKQKGYTISRTNVAGYWKTVNKTSSPQIGELVFFQNTYKAGPSHVGIYLGNGQFINANSDGVAIDSLSNSYWKSRILGYGSF